MFDKVIRQQVHVTGEVQAVGFRWRARMAADRLGLTGWVCNLSDGSVEMEIQGTRAGIDAMLDMIDRSPYIVMENIERTTIPTVGHESGFAVRFDD